MFGSSLPLSLSFVFVGRLVSDLRYLCFFAYSSIQHNVLCFCFGFLCLVYPILPVSLDCPFLIGPLVLSNVYLLNKIYHTRVQTRCQYYTHQQYYSLVCSNLKYYTMTFVRGWCIHLTLSQVQDIWPLYSISTSDTGDILLLKEGIKQIHCSDVYSTYYV